MCACVLVGDRRNLCVNDVFPNGPFLVTPCSFLSPSPEVHRAGSHERQVCRGTSNLYRKNARLNQRTLTILWHKGSDELFLSVLLEPALNRARGFMLLRQLEHGPKRDPYSRDDGLQLQEGLKYKYVLHDYGNDVHRA